MIIINVFQNNQNALLHVLAGPTGVEITEDGELVPGSEDLHFMNLSTIRAATDDFTDSNKLGQGGFGPVYKVRLLYFHGSKVGRGLD